VLAEILTDFPETFAERRNLWLSTERDPAREYLLEHHWLHKGRIVLKFAGVDSISDAEQLKNKLVQISAAARVELNDGFYVSDLVGSRLLDVNRHKEVGIIQDVLRPAGAAPILVVQHENNVYDIPLAREYVVGFDAEQKVLEMKLPDGLLEVNAPISKQEKNEQREK